MPKSLQPDPSTDILSSQETADRERRVLEHFLASKPEPHKQLGKNPQATRRKRERRDKTLDSRA